MTVPPLRERPENIPALEWAFVKEYKKRMGKEIETIPRKTMDALQSYSWPGNVRELRNLVERAMILSRNKALSIRITDLEKVDDATALKAYSRNLGDMEREHIMAVLEKTGWRVSGRGGAAEVLGLNRSTLLSKMKKLNISRPSFQ